MSDTKKVVCTAHTAFFSFPILLACIFFVLSIGAANSDRPERRIINAKRVLPTIDKSNALEWPSDIHHLRALSGREAWKDWKPENGMIGEVVHDWSTMVLLKVGEHHAVFSVEGLTEVVVSPLFRAGFEIAKETGNKNKNSMIAGAFCGKTSVNVLVSQFYARLAILFEEQSFSFKVNGDMHVALCKDNPYSFNNDSGVHVKQSTIIASTPCLKQQLEGAYLGVHVSLRVDQRKKDEIQVMLSGSGILSKIGGTKIIKMSRAACATVYADEGGHKVATLYKDEL